VTTEGIEVENGEVGDPSWLKEFIIVRALKRDNGSVFYFDKIDPLFLIILTPKNTWSCDIIEIHELAAVGV